jgi:hypothetical protein
VKEQDCLTNETPERLFWSSFCLMSLQCLWFAWKHAVGGNNNPVMRTLIEKQRSVAQISRLKNKDGTLTVLTEDNNHMPTENRPRSNIKGLLCQHISACGGVSVTICWCP